MRNRQGLAKLSPTHRALHQFSKKHICVIVESLHVCACQNYKCVDGAADIKLRILWFAKIPSGSHLTEMLVLICSAFPR